MSNINHAKYQESSTETNIPIHSPNIVTGENVNYSDQYTT